MSYALFLPAIDPVAFRLGPVEIHWYGLAYVLGIAFAWRYARALASDSRLWNAKPPFGSGRIDDFLLWGAAGAIIGGRIGYVLFYDFASYWSDPLGVLMVWRGGMSFHGGLLGMILSIWIFSRRGGFSTLSLFDVIAASAGPGIFLVRLANFVNRELWGKPTEMPWGVTFPEAGPDPRHPTQLYEAFLEGLLIFVLLRTATHGFGKLNRPGFVGGAFLLLYGTFRIAVEFFRLPDEHIGYLLGDWLTMGMILSSPLIAVGAWVMFRARPASDGEPFERGA